MRYVPIIALLAIVLTGCFGSSSPKMPGTDTPTNPDDLFSGETTQLVVQVTDSSISPPVAPFAVAAANDEAKTHLISIQTPLYNDAGFAVNSRFTILEVPATQHTATAAIEIAALRNHDVTVVRFKNGNLISFGRTTVDTPAGMMTTANVELASPSFALHMAEPLRGNREVRAQVSVDVENPPGTPMVFGDVVLGINPWTENGWQAAVNANGFDEAWNTDLAYSFFADVTEPTTLYYQVRLCVGASYLPVEYRLQLHCVYVPDVEAGQQLDTVTLYPEYWTF